MLLQEIKDRLPHSSPAEVVDLTIAFERALQKLCEFHADYVHFYQEYASDINYLRATRDSDNGKELLWFVDTTIGIGERLKIEANVAS